jgi:hypothetical protein
MEFDMSATFSMTMTTCSDYAFSRVVHSLRASGITWQRNRITGGLLFDHGRLDEIGDNYFDSEESEAHTLSLLDDLYKSGEKVLLPMSVPSRYSFNLRKVEDATFTFLLDAGRERISPTWLTEVTSITEDLILPMFRDGICIRSVSYEDENW